MRSLLLAAAAVGLAVAPARAADLDKYIPADAGFYVHVTTKNFLAAPVIRTAIPLAVDKYSDQIVMLAGMAKAFNPNTPDIPQDQLKQGLNELKKKENIEKGFDTAKEFGPEIVVCGNPEGNDPENVLILVRCHEAVSPELVSGFMPQIKATGQLKVNESKVGKATVYEITVPQQNQTFFAAVPEAGVICVGMKKAAVETAVQATASKVSPALKALIAKRSDKDFVFAAAVKGTGDARQTFVADLVLDKDISGKITATFASEQEAKEKAEEISNQVKQAVDGLKGMLGDSKDLTAQLDKMKATASGKTVSFNGTIPGGVVEKLLAKDK